MPHGPLVFLFEQVVTFEGEAILLVLVAHIHTFEGRLERRPLRDDDVFVAEVCAFVGPWDVADAQTQVLSKAVLELQHRAEPVVRVHDRVRIVLEVLDHVKRHWCPESEPPLAWVHAIVVCRCGERDDRELTTEVHLPGKPASRVLGMREPLRPGRNHQLVARRVMFGAEWVVERQVPEHPGLQFAKQRGGRLGAPRVGDTLRLRRGLGT